MGLLNSPSAPDSFKIAGQAIADLLHAGEKDEGAPVSDERAHCNHPAPMKPSGVDVICAGCGSWHDKLGWHSPGIVPSEVFSVGHLAAEEAAILDSVISKIGQAVEKAVRKAVHDEFMAHALSLAVPGEAAREEAAEKDPVRPTD